MNSFPVRIAVIALFSLWLVACSNGNSNPEPTAADGKAILIATRTASVMDLPVWLKTVGTVRSVTAPTVAAEVDGRITMVHADTGDSIEAGQLLAETDTSTLVLRKAAAKAALERLEVHIANGQRRVDRFETLSARNLSSQTQLEDAREQLEAFRADYKAAGAQLALVEDSLAKSRVLAPVPGVIQQRMIAKGDFVKRGQALFEITQPKRLQAWLPVPESVALKVRIGQQAKISSPLIPDETINGEISELQPSVGGGSRAVMAIVNIGNPGQLRPSATLTGEILIENRQSAVMVPNLSIVQRPAGNVVYVIKGNKAEARLVTTGNHKGTLIEILSGLDGNETIATDGAAFLTDGATVTIRES